MWRWVGKLWMTLSLSHVLPGSRWSPTRCLTLKKQNKQNMYFFKEKYFCKAYCFAERCGTRAFSWKSLRVSPHSRTDEFSMGGTKMSGQIHISPLLKWIFPSCQGVKSGFSDTLRRLLADSELPFPIGSASATAFLPTVRYSGFPIRVPGQRSSGKLFLFHLTHTLIYWDLTLFRAWGTIPTFQLRKYITSPSSCNACHVSF